jgi:hypothetical protein
VLHQDRALVEEEERQRLRERRQRGGGLEEVARGIELAPRVEALLEEGGGAGEGRGAALAERAVDVDIGLAGCEREGG